MLTLIVVASVLAAGGAAAVLGWVTLHAKGQHHGGRRQAGPPA